MKHTVFAACICLIWCGNILVLRKGQCRTGLPGGKREHGETVGQCAARELWEECRLRVAKRTYVGSYTAQCGGETSRLGGETVVTLVYVIQNPDDLSEPRGNAREGTPVWEPAEMIGNTARFSDYNYGLLTWLRERGFVETTCDRCARLMPFSGKHPLEPCEMIDCVRRCSVAIAPASTCSRSTARMSEEPDSPESEPDHESEESESSCDQCGRSRDHWIHDTTFTAWEFAFGCGRSGVHAFEHDPDGP